MRRWRLTMERDREPELAADFSALCAWATLCSLAASLAACIFVLAFA